MNKNSTNLNENSSKIKSSADVKEKKQRLNFNADFIRTTKSLVRQDRLSEIKAGVYRDNSFNNKGLLLRVSPKGKLTYIVHGRIAKKDSKAQYYTIGNASEISLEDARRIAVKFKGYMADGKNPSFEHKKDTKQFTLQMFFDEYLSAKGVKSIKNKKGLQQDTIKEYNKSFDRLTDKFKKRDALKITRDDIKKEHNRIALAHTDFMSDKTMHVVLALYNSARKRHINEAENIEFINHNPVEVLNIDESWKVNNGQSRRKRECIDTDDLKSVLDALEALEFYKDGVKFKHKTTPATVICSHYFRLMFFTGWRPEDTVGIKWSQVTDDCKEITWDDSEAIEMLKGGEEQYRFPLNSEAIKVLKGIKSYKFKSEFVFPTNKLTTALSQNPTIYIDVLQKLVNNNKRYTAGIYRKTFQTYAEECGVNQNTIKRLVFHTQRVYDTQSGYIASRREALRKHSQKVCDFLLYYAKRSDQSTNEQVSIQSDLLLKVSDIARDSELTRDEMLNKLLETGIQFEMMKKMTL